MPSLRFLFAPCRSFASLLADRYLKFPLVISSQYHKQCVSSPVALRIRDSMCLHLSCVCKNVRRSRGPAHSHVPHGSPRHILLLHVHSPPAPPPTRATHPPTVLAAASIKSISSQPGREDEVPAMLLGRSLPHLQTNRTAEPTQRVCESSTAHCTIPGSTVGKSIASSYLERETEQPAL